MADTEAVLQGGPRDGTTFQAEGAGLIELEIDGMVHRYVPTTKNADGRAVYTYDGMVDPDGAQDGVEHAKDRLASPLAKERDSDD